MHSCDGFSQPVQLGRRPKICSRWMNECSGISVEVASLNLGVVSFDILIAISGNHQTNASVIMLTLRALNGSPPLLSWLTKTNPPGKNLEFSADAMISGIVR